MSIENLKKNLSSAVSKMNSTGSGANLTSKASSASKSLDKSNKAPKHFTGATGSYTSNTPSNAISKSGLSKKASSASRSLAKAHSKKITTGALTPSKKDQFTSKLSADKASISKIASGAKKSVARTSRPVALETYLEKKKK